MTEPIETANVGKGVYVHVPFCRSKCAYCDFYSVACKPSDMQKYVDAAICEWHLRCNEVPGPIRTVYIGGGTPSVLDAKQITRIVGEISGHACPTEITIECNPDSVDFESARIWRDAGINRISMGVQTFNDDCLATVGRRHNRARALEAFRVLRSVGFENISLDLIYGLPGQSMDIWHDDVRIMMDLHPEHFSAYLLFYAEGTRLYRMREDDPEKFDQGPDETEMYRLLCEKARAAGYEHYEISNFALPGYRSSHNMSYWQQIPYIGIGPGAHSFDGKKRRVNPQLPEYLNAINSGAVAAKIEEESPEDITNDLIITALRTSDGLDINMIDPLHRAAVLKNISTVPKHLLKIKEGRYYIPEDGYMFSDSVMRALII